MKLGLQGIAVLPTNTGIINPVLWSLVKSSFWTKDSKVVQPFSPSHMYFYKNDDFKKASQVKICWMNERKTGTVQILPLHPPTSSFGDSDPSQPDIIAN